MASREQRIAELEASMVELVERLDVQQDTIEGLAANRRDIEIEKACPLSKRTHLPDNFEGRKDP